MDWQKDAACLGEDPELFFPIGNSGPGQLQAEEAKSVCRRCPVMERCLTWAVTLGSVEGVWGGTTEGERLAMRRREYRERFRNKRDALM